MKRCSRALAALLVVWLVPIPIRAAEGRSPGVQPVITGASNPRRIAAAGGLSQSETETREVIRFWLTLENHSGEAIRNVRLQQLDVPGFAVEHLAWHNQQGAQHCDLPEKGHPAIAGTDMTSCGVLTAELDPEESLSLQGDLKALGPHDRQNLTALVEWKNLNNRVSQSTVSLGDAVIRSACEKFWSRAYEALKDFALPIVLALLAFGLGLWDKAREGRRQAEERHRTQLAETWNRMLSESHRLTTRYYLHIASGGEAILQFDRLYREEAAKGAQKSDAQLEQYAKRQLFYLVYLERRYIHLLDSAGGFYFKNRTGERLVNACLESFLASYTEQWKEEIWGNLTAMARIIDLNETGDSFLKKLRGEGDTPNEAKNVLGIGWANFQKWRASVGCELALSYLRALLVILSYEMNRPYEYWYGEQEKLLVDNDILKTLRGLAVTIQDATKRQRFTSELERYLGGE